MKDFIGQTIDRYQILEQLGEGGMATVYKAYDSRLERHVAVKVLRSVGQEPTETFLKRFEREARALAQLTHPNIVRIIDYGKYNGMPYLVMEYLPGGTLADKMGKSVPYQQAARMLAPVADALAYAHLRGFLHRDVKPSNILVTESGQSMLADFGIVRIIGSQATTELTATGVGIGTPAYMAPEQWMGKAESRTDLYALGIVFYELVTGRLPYIADTPAAVLLKHVNDPLPRPRQFARNLPDSVEHVIFKALAKKPQDRFSDLAAFAAVLEKLVQGAQVSPGKISAAPGQTARRSPLPVGRFGLFGLLGLMMIVLTGLVILFATGVIGIQKKPTQDDVNQEAASSAGQLSSTPTPEENLVPGPVNTSTNAQTAVLTPTLPPTLTPSPTPTRLSIGSTMVSPVDSMTLVYVPAGEFPMGAEDGDPDERPVHTVKLDAFWVDQTEVSNAMFAQCVEAGHCSPPSDYSSYTRDQYYGNSSYNHFPVIYVSWHQSQNYCSWAGRRLPTEAEWEKTARGTDGRAYPWGNGSMAGNLLNFADSNTDFGFAYRSIDDGYGDTSPVGNYKDGQSPYFALDMAGNVWEWVADWYSDNYYNNSPSSNPKGSSSGAERALRGGSWSDSRNDVRSSQRLASDPSTTHYAIGFRCAQSPR